MATSKPLVDDFPAVRVSDLRVAAGGRRQFNAASYFTVEIGEGQAVRVDLVPRMTNLGGTMRLLVCPGCGGAARVLRAVGGSVGLVCVRCLSATLGARYASQDR